jgi:DNA-binding transcriptional ArsR family regulator
MYVWKPFGYLIKYTMRRDVYQAIADPTRREIINLIAQKPLNLHTVAENFEVSRPAISKHIKILAECGLVVIKQVGRERFCEAKLQKLNEVSLWLEQYKVFWTKKLDALDEFLLKENSDGKKIKQLKNVGKRKVKVIRKNNYRS